MMPVDTKHEGRRIVFMGTPDFAVPSLDILHKSTHQVVGVVTVPDKPAGRGRQLRSSPVKEYALQNSLDIFQPEKLKDPEFLLKLEALKADLFVVVAFRMLPEQVWRMPPLGCFNLHASLLPQYRGAAPINRAIMNGETITGVTTFFIEKDIDTGNILFQESLPIGEKETAGELHDRLMDVGSRLVLKTVNAISEGSIRPIQQKDVLPSELKMAPKIFRDDCEINWNRSGKEIVQQIRGLSPFPGAFTFLCLQDEKFQMKIFQADFQYEKHSKPAGTLQLENGNCMKIFTFDGHILLESIQTEGKKRMSAADFLRGFQRIEGLSICSTLRF